MRLVTNAEKGLDLSDASARLEKYGPNRLPQGRKRSPVTRFFAQFNNILIYVLLAAGFTKLMLSLWIDAGIIYAVVVLNALLGFIQEGKAEKALESISPATSSRIWAFRPAWIGARSMNGTSRALTSMTTLVPRIVPSPQPNPGSKKPA